MTNRAKKISWVSAIAVVVSTGTFLTSNGFVMPWEAVHRREAKEQIEKVEHKLTRHTESVERRLETMSHRIGLIMGALGVKE